MTFRTTIRVAFAAAIFAASMAAVIHVHLPASNNGETQASISNAACACDHHQHSGDTPLAPNGPNSDDCHFCKLLSQIAGETPGVLSFETGDLSRQPLLIKEIRRSSHAAFAYLGRGPPCSRNYTINS